MLVSSNALVCGKAPPEIGAEGDSDLDATDAGHGIRVVSPGGRKPNLDAPGAAL